MKVVRTDWLLGALAFFAFPALAHATRIGDVTELDWGVQTLRFLSLRDVAVRNAVLGSIFMGVSCGLFGGYVVARRLALFGDTLAHAVLPGVALGFLWSRSKDPVAIFVGATVAGLLGTVVIAWIRKTTRVKEDSALGLVLSGFYAVGICILTVIQEMEFGNQSGIDKFLFGQAAALSSDDVGLMGVVAIGALMMVTLFNKELLVTSFDEGFARSVGVPVEFIRYVLLVGLTFAVVTSLQTVGVVLVSALLITPAATAYLLTDRMGTLLLLSALFGVAGGLLGSYGSFLGNNLPTGPFMVLACTSFFAIAFFCGPKHGLVSKWLRRRNRVRQVSLENTMKAVYQVLEAGDFAKESVTVGALAARRRTSVAEARREADDLVNSGFASMLGSDDAGPRYSQDARLFLTPAGWERACQIVRNHRLWELYLTNEAHYAADHVHEDAEKIEHVLGEKVVRQLERILKDPRRDPHGKVIPSLEDIEHGAGLSTNPASATGYFQQN
ncbi:MAG: iron chelate uptake ABC transporter family permease subunit [Opitutales bacterium]